MSVRHECERKEFVRVKENNCGWEVTVKGREEQFSAQRSLGTLPCVGVGIRNVSDRVQPLIRMIGAQ